MKNNSDLAKIVFRVPDEDGECYVETLWCRPLGADRYELDNSPFYAYSVSWKDVVLAPYDAAEQRPVFQSVVEKSGHKTIRVAFGEAADSAGTSQSVLDQLVALGCTYEGANPQYISVDIPPEVSLESVREFMIEKDLQFEHADPTYEELFPEDAGS